MGPATEPRWHTMPNYNTIISTNIEWNRTEGKAKRTHISYGATNYDMVFD